MKFLKNGGKANSNQGFKVLIKTKKYMLFLKNLQIYRIKLFNKIKKILVWLIIKKNIW